MSTTSPRRSASDVSAQCGHTHADDHTTLCTRPYLDSDSGDRELRVCGVGQEAYFEWVTERGDPVGDVFDEIDLSDIALPEQGGSWPVKNVRINLVATARFRYSEVLSVPTSMTDSELSALVDRRYNEVPAEAYTRDPDSWKRSSFYPSLRRRCIALAARLKHRFLR